MQIKKRDNPYKLKGTEKNTNSAKPGVHPQMSSKKKKKS